MMTVGYVLTNSSFPVPVLLLIGGATHTYHSDLLPKCRAVVSCRGSKFHWVIEFTY